MSRARFDVAVVGGGAVGASLALALDHAGFRSVLVEAGEVPVFDPAQMDLRVYALSPASLALLQRLGVREPLAQLRCAPYQRMSVWQHGGEALNFDAELIGEPVLGAIAEDQALRAALWQRLAQSGVERRTQVKVQRFEPGASDVRLGLDDGSVIRATLIVACDGVASPLRALAGLSIASEPYAESAIVAHVRSERPHQATAWQCFGSDGPLAFLPLADGRSSIVWSVPKARAASLLTLDRSAFAAALEAAFDSRLGALELDSERAALPLNLQLASRWVGARLALAGDAAHAVHPLAGQGLNLGLLDIAALVDVLSAARSTGADIGAAACLRDYERWRQGDAVLTARAFDWINGLFRSQVPLLPWLRGRGLGWIDRVRPLKREFARHASGFGGRVPSLSQRLPLW